MATARQSGANTQGRPWKDRSQISSQPDAVVRRQIELFYKCKE